MSIQIARDVALFLIGFVFLTGGAELLVRGASRLAARLGIRNAVIGLTVVAFGTSLPELLVSMVANVSGESDIAIGNIVGSNIANMGLILGVGALLSPLYVDSRIVRREFPLVLAVSLAFVVMAWDGQIGLVEGILLVLGLAWFTYSSYTATETSPVKVLEGRADMRIATTVDEAIGRPSTNPWLDAGLVLIGLGGLILGANWLVSAAESLARAFGVSELIIGLTLVAVGTSLPELATTVIAVRRREADIAVGNVVGSNLFNMLFIGGLSALIHPLAVQPRVLTADLPVMVGITLAVFLMTLRPPFRFERWQGGILLAVYLTYMVWLFTGGN
jgi:cation:H+ antiporter